MPLQSGLRHARPQNINVQLISTGLAENRVFGTLCTLASRTVVYLSPSGSINNELPALVRRCDRLVVELCGALQLEQHAIA